MVGLTERELSNRLRLLLLAEKDLLEDFDWKWGAHFAICYLQFSHPSSLHFSNPTNKTKARTAIR
jgi:hypothetical protein